MRNLGIGLLLVLAVASSSPVAAQSSTAGSSVQGILGTCQGLIQTQNNNTDLFFRCREILVNDSDQALVVARDELGTAGRNATEAAVSQTGNLASRMSQVRSGASGVSIGDLRFDGDDWSFPEQSVLAQLNGARGGAASADQHEGEDEAVADPLEAMSGGKWGVFVNGDAAFGDRDPGTEDVGFDFDSLGVTFGLDYRFSDDFFGGVALGFSEANNELTGGGGIDGNGSGSLDVEGTSFSLYGSKVLTESLYVDGSVSLGSNDYDSTTNVNYTINKVGEAGTTTVNQQALGDTAGDSLGFSLALGHDRVKGANSLQTSLRFDYLDLEIDGYTEQMSNPSGDGNEMALQVLDQNIESLTANIEVTFAHTKSADWGIFIPQVRAGVVHEFSDDPRQVTTRLASDPNIAERMTTFAGPCATGCDKDLIVFTDEAESDFFTLGVGFSTVFKGGNQAFLFYDTILGRGDLTYNAITAGFRFEL